MDVIKELKDVREAIEDAMADGRLSIRDFVRIVRELVDVLVIVLPLVTREPVVGDKKPE